MAGWVPLTDVQVEHDISPLERKHSGRFTGVFGRPLGENDSGTSRLYTRFAGWLPIDEHFPIYVKLNSKGAIQEISYLATDSSTPMHAIPRTPSLRPVYSDRRLAIKPHHPFRQKRRY
jgi:hypothetical protein